MTPLETRYQSDEMVNLFKDAFALSTKKTLLLELERAQKALGVKPSPPPSHYITENTRLIRLKVGMAIIEKRLHGILVQLDRIAVKYAKIPCPNTFDQSEPTTIGKHFALFLQDFLWDYQALTNYNVPFLGFKGSSGSQTALLKHFDGNEEKVKQLDESLAAAMGFSEAMTLSTHTYPKKIDRLIQSRLSHIAESAREMAYFLKEMPYLGETSKKLLEHLYELSKEPTESFMRVDAILKLAMLSLDALSIQKAAMPSDIDTGRSSAQVMELHEHLRLFSILKR